MKMESQNTNVFPLFLNIVDKQILVVGAGHIGARRIKKLHGFSCKIKVVSRTLPEELLEGVEYIQDEFCEQYLEGCHIVIATTDEKDVNRGIYELCKARGILVNICDNKELCDFYFPAIFETEELIGGVVSKTGAEHTLVKNAAQKIRRTFQGNGVDKHT